MSSKGKPIKETKMLSKKKKLKIEGSPIVDDKLKRTGDPVEVPEVKKEFSDKKRGKDWRYFKKSKEAKEKPSRGVVYVKSLPHGFYEKQLEGYFGQFGKVTGVYVPKSRKTGRAKGYGFVEFLHPEVAEVAAETMNNYLMFNRLIKTELIPPEKQRPSMFSEKYKKMKHRYAEPKATQIVNKQRKSISKNRNKYVSRAAKKMSQLQDSLKNLGFQYNFKVVGQNENVTLTGLKNIDPDQNLSNNKQTESENRTEDTLKTNNKKNTNKKRASKKKKSDTHNNDQIEWEHRSEETVQTNNQKSTDKKKASKKKVSVTCAYRNKGKTSAATTDLALTSIAFPTKGNILKKTSQLVAAQKRQLASSKDKAKKIVKTISKAKNTAKSINLKKKVKKTALPANNKTNKVKVKLETTV